MARNILIHTRNLCIPGGKQSYLIALQEHFENDVSYFYYGSQKPVKESIVGFIKRFLGDYIKFYRLLKEGDFDLVQINTSFNPKSYFRDSIFTLISKKLNYKTVVYWHGWRSDFEHKYARKLRAYFRLTFGQADAMICLAKEFSNTLKDYYFKKPIFLETTVVADDILNHFNIIPAIDSTRSKKDQKIILFLSRVEQEKGIYETLDSFQKLQSTVPNTVLHIAGIGDALERVKNSVAEKKIHGVEFLGWVEGHDKIKAFAEADIYVLPSYSEGMSIAILEAMAMGLPIITTDIGSIKDYFEEGKMGYKVRTHDTDDLKEKLEHLLRNDELRAEMSNFNMTYASNHFSSEKVCRRLESIYEYVIDDMSIHST